MSSPESNLEFAPRRSKSALEEELDFAPKFDANGLLPAIALDHQTREPLMLAYMNEQSLKMTIELGEAVYYSRSRQEIWHKGATSGHVQKVKELLTDCDQDAIVLMVEQVGAGACHTGRKGCFYRKIVMREQTDNHATNSNQPVKLTWTQHGDRNFDPNAVYHSK